MNSPLSAGTRNAPFFDQAAQSVACIAELLAEASVSPEQVNRLAFFVVAPRSQIDSGIFTQQMAHAPIRAKVLQRVQHYQNPQKAAWFVNSFEPMLRRMTIDCLSWESLLDTVESVAPEDHRALRSFYNLCQRLAE